MVIQKDEDHNFLSKLATLTNARKDINVVISCFVARIIRENA